LCFAEQRGKEKGKGVNNLFAFPRNGRKGTLLLRSGQGKKKRIYPAKGIQRTKTRGGTCPPTNL